MAQTLSTIKSLLASRGVRPRQSLGQNFLHDANKLRAILDAAELSPGDRVLEVGPGTGTLTEALLDAGARVVAVELDDVLVSILRERLGGDRENWTLLHTDALAGKHRVNPAVEQALGGRDRPFKLVANLPYNIASPLLATLAADWPGMRLAIVMIQREVADRIVAAPGSRVYGPIGVILRAMCEVERVDTLPPTCFWPRPKVSSAVLRLTRRDRPLATDPHRLASFLQRVFSKRRKQLGAILGRDAPLPPGIDPASRPEQLTVAQLIDLSQRLG